MDNKFFNFLGNGVRDGEYLERKLKEMEYL